jgi:hypothetical protein
MSQKIIVGYASAPSSAHYCRPCRRLVAIIRPPEARKKLTRALAKLENKRDKSPPKEAWEYSAVESSHTVVNLLAANDAVRDL